MLDDIRNILVILTTLATIIIVLIKSINNFFYDVIKLKFDNSIQSKSIFRIVTNGIIYLIIALDLVLGIIVLFSLGDRMGSIIKSTTQQNIIISVLTIILLIVLIIVPTASSAGIIMEFRSCVIYYINAMKNISVEDFNKKKLKKVMWCEKILWIYWAILTIIVIAIIVGNFEIIIEYGNIKGINNLDNDDLGIIISFLQLSIISGTFAIAASSLRVALEKLSSKRLYNFIIDNDNHIEVKCYLEYDEYYLIFKDSIERYIKKSEVKEIIKKNEIEVMRSEERETIKNVKLFNKIHSPKLKKQYSNLRELIKQEYKSNSEYNYLSNINLEIERLNNYVKMLSNPFISIIISIESVVIPLVIPEDYKSWLFTVIYGIILLLVFSTLIIKINDKFMIAIISIDVLDELKENLIKETK